MEFICVNVVHQTGIGAASKKPYDFYIVGGLIATARGKQFVELMIEKDHPVVEEGKRYMIELELYPDREKKLKVRVAGLRPVEGVRKAA